MRFAKILVVPAVIVIAACSKDSAGTADSIAALDNSAVMAMPGDTAGMSAAMPTSTSGMMDPNSASAADLATIPGVTPAVAAGVTAARPFTNNVALDKALGGLSEQQRDSVFSRLWTPIDLNTATDGEILLVPGVGSKMLREFKEYRPYTSMDQFRREIGKYVDATELARLERFVTIR